MDAYEWSLAITVLSGAQPVSGAVFVGKHPRELTAESLPALIGEVTRIAPRREPERIVVVHPKTMGVDEVGEWLSAIVDLGVRGKRVDTVTDTEALARALYGGEDTRDIVVIDGGSGEAHTRGGARGELDSVPRLVADAGVLTTETVVVGARTRRDGSPTCSTTRRCGRSTASRPGWRPWPTTRRCRCSRCPVPAG